jgi:hypothetical protein
MSEDFRDHVAGLMMAGLVVGTDLVKAKKKGFLPDHAVAAKFCYDAADALIHEKEVRETRKPNA